MLLALALLLATRAQPPEPATTPVSTCEQDASAMTKKLEQKTQLALQSALSIANRILYDASCAGTPSAEKAKAARDHIDRTLKSIAASHREAALRFETAHDYASARREIRLALMSTPSDAELSKEAGRILAEFKAAASKTPLPPPDKP